MLGIPRLSRNYQEYKKMLGMYKKSLGVAQGSRSGVSGDAWNTKIRQELPGVQGDDRSTRS
jgi:hypothetical protein